MTKILRTISLILALIFAGLSPQVVAADAGIASNVIVSGVQASQAERRADTPPTEKIAPALNVTVGTPFSIKLRDNKNCSMIKSYDQINLLINGMETGLHPLGCDPATRILVFSLNKDDVIATPVSNAAWQAMLGRPWNTPKSDFKRELRYTVTQPASSDDDQIMSSGTIKLLIASFGFVGVGAVLVLALWLSLIFLGRNSGMLRDAGNQGSALHDRTYSLGYVQMAWWFGIIIGSYIFLWAITRNMPSIGGQALLLMGISGATGLTSAGLNSGLKKELPISKGNFFEDILTDAQGITLHRFQMLAMTVILGVIFIIHVATTLAMPEFDGSFLAMMGIAGGTYVGFKIPERHVDGQSVPGAAAPLPSEDHKAGYSPEPEAQGDK